MGCVVFIFDMLGYADSNQIQYEVAHRHAQPRPQESDRERPCFFSVDADLNLQSIMGLQTWNAIRSLDFLSQQEDVDPNRLGVTGGSGGGTQTIMLGAIDARIKVGFPNGMVSTSMQGGCYCENCNYLRIDTGNVELAALFAPRPQGMTAANDWTRDMMFDGYPQLKQLYRITGDESDVACRALLQFPHNYNYHSRAAMYAWMARHLGLPDETPLIEADFEPLSQEEMTVWTDRHPAPQESGIEHERRVLDWWQSQNDRAIQALLPRRPSSASRRADQLDEFRSIVGGAWRTFFDRELPDRSDLIVEKADPDEDDAQRFVIQHRVWGTTVHVQVDAPEAIVPPSKTVRVEVGERPHKISGNAVRTDQTPHRIVRLKFDSIDRQSLVDNNKSYSAFTFGYNRPLVVKRFEQILCVLAAFEADGQCPDLIAYPDACSSATAAAVAAGEKLDSFVVHTDGFRFASASHYSDPSFLPGAVKYLDLPGLLAQRAPHPLDVVGDDRLELVTDVYHAAGAANELRVQP